MMAFPTDLSKEFELEPGEEVLVEARKHWILIALQLLPFAILALLPLFFSTLLSFAPQLSPYAHYASAVTPGGRILYGLWLLVVWTSAWGFFTRYYLNVWILTNLRVVEITQRHFFDRQVSSTLLNRVQDVTTEVSGLLFSLLGIGNIHVQSAGTVDEFHMEGVANPEQLRDLILARVSTDSKSSGV